MTRLRAILAAAALLVVGGVAIPLALQQAGDSASPPMKCSEWSQLLDSVSEQQQWETFFVGATSANLPPPKAYGNYILGDCAAGMCTVSHATCPGSLSYSYQLSPLVNGKRVARFLAPLIFAKGWYAWATHTAGVRFMRSFKEAASECLSLETAANCRSLLSGVSDCWLRADGQLCRYGRLFGPGMGGTTTCAVQAGDQPYPCETMRSAEEEGARVWTDAELQ